MDQETLGTNNKELDSRTRTKTGKIKIDTQLETKIPVIDTPTSLIIVTLNTILITHTLTWLTLTLINLLTPTKDMRI